jgi:hypothetical protein
VTPERVLPRRTDQRYHNVSTCAADLVNKDVGAKVKEPAMSQELNGAFAVIGIDMGMGLGAMAFEGLPDNVPALRELMGRRQWVACA